MNEIIDELEEVQLERAPSYFSPRKSFSIKTELEGKGESEFQLKRIF